MACVNIICLNDLKNLLNNNNVFLYGAGNICKKILKIAEYERLIKHVRCILVTNLDTDCKEISNIKIQELKKDEIVKDIIIVAAVGTAKNEIKNILQSRNFCFFELQPSIEKELDDEIKKIRYESAVEKVKNFVLGSRKENKEDIRFFSTPYWDAYAPFSAVPCLVACLKEKGYKVGQVDLGIICFHEVLRKKWKIAAKDCSSVEFYNEYIKNYKHNTYQNYTSFVNDLWFFEKEDFNLAEVKKSYCELNSVQKMVIDGFYSKLMYMDEIQLDIDQCKNIYEAVNTYIDSDFIEQITSEHVIQVFENLPDIIGISVTWPGQLIQACLLAKIVKAVNPHAIIFMGGSCTDYFLKSDYPQKSDLLNYFDYLMIGEGETVITELISSIKNKKGIESIPNLVRFHENGEPYVKRQIVENVETLSCPDFDGLDLDLYLAPETILPYQSSRGCHYGQCAFCNHDSMYRHNYRSKELNVVVNDLISLSKRYNVHNFQFVDEAIRPDCFIKMIDEMEANPEFKNINWFYYSRVSRKYDEEILKKAYKCGCRMVMFGVETLNHRLLKFIKKGIDPETSKYCLELFHKSGIKTYAWLMCNLPSETMDEARKDLLDVKHISKYMDAFSVGPFCLVKNTDMYLEPEKYNIISFNDKEPTRFVSMNDGNVIDKDEMLDFYEKEYARYQKDFFSIGNRYTLFFEGLTKR